MNEKQTAEDGTLRERKLRVFVADDQINVRTALRLLLEQELDMALVGEAADATGLLVAAEKQPLDLVLLDWELPGLSPQQLVRLLRHERPLLLIVAMSSRPEARKHALAAGAAAFFSKGDPPDIALATLRGLVKSSGSY